MKASTRLLLLSLIFFNLLTVLVYIHYKTTANNDVVINNQPRTQFKINGLPLVNTTNQLKPKGASSSNKVQSNYRPLCNISWSDFLSIKHTTIPSTSPSDDKIFEKYDLNICPSHIVEALNKPELSEETIQWCRWALSPTGGKVIVGKSYGSLQKKDRDKYEQLNCNAVAKGINPSCDTAWGDAQITSWRSQSSGDVCGNSKRNSNNVIRNNNAGVDASALIRRKTTKKYGSNIKCFDSQSEARFCVFENVLLDFSKMHNKKRDRNTDTRTWDKGFLASDCDAEKYPTLDHFFSFYSPSIDVDNTICNMVYTEPVLQMSHDDIDNLGHSLSDFMNVWAMLWLSGYGSSMISRTQQISFLNIDAIRQGHNYYDKINQFFSHYQHNFKQILQASAFPSTAKVCFKTLIFQPNPVLLFTWDGWWEDRICSFVGPSSLFQRWNMQIRQSYNLLKLKSNYIDSTVTTTTTTDTSKLQAMLTDSTSSTNSHSISKNKWRILLILRKPNPHDNSTKYASRIMSNSDEIIAALKTLHHPLPSSSSSSSSNKNSDKSSREKVEVIAVDLAALSFTVQIELIASVSIVIGMHGAGMATTMHMAVGSNSNGGKHVLGGGSTNGEIKSNLRDNNIMIAQSSSTVGTSNIASGQSSSDDESSLKCCGVIEMFPSGEFTPIKGYGNMARRMGHVYSRLDIETGSGLRSSSNSGMGTKIDVKELMKVVIEMMKTIEEMPSCVLPSVIQNPYFTNSIQFFL